MLILETRKNRSADAVPTSAIRSEIINVTLPLYLYDISIIHSNIPTRHNIHQYQYKKIYNKVNNRCLFVHRADICISNYKNLSIFLYWVAHILPVLGGWLNLEFSNNNNNNNNNHTMSLVNSSFKICGIQLNIQNRKKIPICQSSWNLIMPLTPIILTEFLQMCIEIQVLQYIV